MENFMEFFFFLIKNRTTIWDSNPTSGYIPEGNEINILKTGLHPCVYRGIVCNSQGMETTQVSIDGEMYKENTIFINTHMPLSLEQLTRCKVRNLLVSYSWPSGCAIQAALDPVVLWRLLWENLLVDSCSSNPCCSRSALCVWCDCSIIKEKANLPLATTRLKLEDIYSK